MTSYAIIEICGKQLRVEPGRFHDVDRIAAEPDETLTIDKVLYFQNDGDITVGQPHVAGATVGITIMQHLRGRKIIVYKMRPKKKTRKKQGHRQELTRFMVDNICMGDLVLGTLKPVTERSAIADVDSEPEDDLELENSVATAIAAEADADVAETIEGTIAEAVEPVVAIDEPIEPTADETDVTIATAPDDEATSDSVETDSTEAADVAIAEESETTEENPDV